MRRRGFIAAMSAVALAGFSGLARTAPPADRRTVEELQKRWKELLPGDADVALSTDPLDLSDAQWRARLTGRQYAVLREEDTERPGSSALNEEQRRGVYACAGCGLPLFTSEMKYESGTGWPSFFTHIPAHLETKPDRVLIWPRTEYHCVRCGGHQGHVFDDGPPPTGERWCNNGVALRFVAAASPG